MSHQIKIIGAGMAGLLAANMLRRHTPRVVERQQSLPNNHSALLRFRSTAVSDATGIPFQKVLVRKGIWDGNQMLSVPTIPLSNIYSLKVTGEVHERSVWNLEPEVRWLAPSNFIDQISACVHIELNSPFSFIDHGNGDTAVAISTLPMPMMMKALNYPSIPEFSHKPIYTLKATITSPRFKIYQTVYNAVLGDNWYRATIHNDELTVESVDPIGDHSGLFTVIYQCFGIKTKVANVRTSEQKFGKILPIDEDTRKHFILWLTEKHNIYSLGRFATWRPLLLDHLVKDIKLIEEMLTTATGYSRRLNARITR